MGNEEFRMEWIKNKLSEIPSGETILDAGAGELRCKPYCGHLAYCSQDFCQYNGNSLSDGLELSGWDTDGIDIVSDIINIPVESESFENILCTEVLEHIPRPELAIKEFARILKEDGLLILTAPFCSLTHFAPYHYCSGFNKYWYETILKENGFEIIEMTSNGNYFSYMCQEMERLSYMERKYGDKGIHWRITKVFAKILKGILSRYCEKTNCSDAVLCFGYNVVAKKL